MRPDRRTLLITGLAAAAAPTMALAGGGPRTVPAKKLFPFFDLYLGLRPADRSHFVMAYYLRRDGKPWSGSGFTLLGADGARTALPVEANGRFQRMPSLADLKANAMVEVPPQGEGKFQLSMEMEALAPMAEVMNPGDFTAAIIQVGAAIKKNAGVLSLVAPKITQVVFVGVPAGTAVLPGGKTAALPLFETLPAYRPATLQGVTELRFPRAPARALLA
jgi:hypothetical protein